MSASFKSYQERVDNDKLEDANLIRVICALLRAPSI
jgi:hypothetical protein